MVVVQGEVGELLVHGELHLVVVVTVLCHGCDSYSVWGKHKESGGVHQNQSQKKKKKNHKISFCVHVIIVGMIVILRVRWVPVLLSGISPSFSSALSTSLLVARRHLLMLSACLSACLSAVLPAGLSVRSSRHLPASNTLRFSRGY